MASGRETRGVVRYLWYVALRPPGSAWEQVRTLGILVGLPILLALTPAVNWGSPWFIVISTLFVTGYVNPFLHWRAINPDLHPILRVTGLELSRDSTAGVYWTLLLVNEGRAIAESCRGDLLAGRRRDDPDLRVKTGPLQWSTGSDMTQTAVLQIRPGHERVLDIAYLDPGPDGTTRPRTQPWPLRVVYAGGERFREAHALDYGIYRFLVEVSADATQSLFCICEIESDGTPEGSFGWLSHSGRDRVEAEWLLGDVRSQ